MSAQGYVDLQYRKSWISAQLYMKAFTEHIQDGEHLWELKGIKSLSSLRMNCSLLSLLRIAAPTYTNTAKPGLYLLP